MSQGPPQRHRTSRFCPQVDSLQGTGLCDCMGWRGKSEIPCKDRLSGGVGWKLSGRRWNCSPQAGILLPPGKKFSSDLKTSQLTSSDPLTIKHNLLHLRSNDVDVKISPSQQHQDWPLAESLGLEHPKLTHETDHHMSKDWLETAAVGREGRSGNSN